MSPLHSTYDHMAEKTLCCRHSGRTFPRGTGDGWRVTGSGWRVAGGGWRVAGQAVKNKKGKPKKKKDNKHYKKRYLVERA